jgi:hypothetical protein
MNGFQKFLMMCSGSNIHILQKSPSEWNKYAGIGGIVLFTAVFATLSASYAMFTVFEDVWISVSDKIMPGQKKPSLSRSFSLDTLVRGRSAAHEDELVVQAWQKDIKQPSEYYKLATEAESQKFLDKFLASYGASVVAASATQKTAEKPVEKVAEKPVTEKVEKKTSKKKEEKVSIEETEASLEDQFSDFKDDEDV